MPISSTNLLRADLVTTKITDRKTSAQRYLIEDPISQETFEFGEEEYFLCQLMDGVTPIPKILAAFQERFKITMTEADYQEFVKQIGNFGLLESPKNQVQPTRINLQNGQKLAPATQSKKSGKSPRFLWKHPNPGLLFSSLARWTKPYHRLFKLSTWLLIPLLPIALVTFWNNQVLFWHDVKLFVERLPFLLTYGSNMLILNLCDRIIMGTVFAAYGGHSTLFGFILGLGFIPHFQVNLKEYQNVPRNDQMWVYASPLIMRLFVFSMGVIVWFSTRNSGTTLSVWILVFAHAALASFLLMLCPLWSLYGYYFLIAALRLPDNFISQSQKAWGMMLWGRRLPSFLLTRDKLILLGFGIGSATFSLLLLAILIIGFAKGIASTFPEIFGPQTTVLTISILLIIGLRAPIYHLIFRERISPVTRRSHTTLTDKIADGQYHVTTSRHSLSSWFYRVLKFLVLVGLVAVLFLPYPTKLGGTLQLLTPKQIEIQAEVDGKSKITRVFFSGGNEQLIKTGTVIAEMKDIDIEDEIETLQSQIDKAMSALQTKQSDLAKLLATPRKENVEVAQNQVDSSHYEVEKAKKEIAIAKQQLEVIKKQLENALTQADFYSRQVSRLEVAYKEGAISLNLLEDLQRQAETNKINAQEKYQLLLQQQKEVEQARSELVIKQQDLKISESNLKVVLSGTHPDEIEAARHNVEAARAELERLRKQQQQAQNKLKLTTLVMPLDGYLVTPYLETKIGSYLEQGETFAIAEDASSILGELEVPEYDIGQFTIDKKVEIKLAAYPNETIIGKVVGITPSATATDSRGTNTSEQSSARFVRVLVEIPYPGYILKTGMSGYGKIEGPTKPVIVAFTTPLVRFFQIEFWSWLP